MTKEIGARFWSRLSGAVRGEQCRLAAREAESRAKSAAPELREVYEILAEQWFVIAEQIKREPTPSGAAKHKPEAVVQTRSRGRDVRSSATKH
jgi:hypothetical protein